MEFGIIKCLKSITAITINVLERKHIKIRKFEKPKSRVNHKKVTPVNISRVGYSKDIKDLQW
tara:strand:+ start:1842 stop:2027 length:186 start_codon:yes stop_codon:yes gene_type:complete